MGRTTRFTIWVVLGWVVGLVAVACSTKPPIVVDDSSDPPISDQSDDRDGAPEPVPADDAIAGAETVHILASVASDGSGTCTFGEVVDCRLLELTLSVGRDSRSGELDVRLDDLTEYLPDTPAVMASMGPNRERLVFMSTANGDLTEFRELYVLDLETEAITPISAGQSWNDLGQWARWLDDETIAYSNYNDCSDPGPACNRSTRYQDLLVASLGEANVTTSIEFGATSPTTGTDTTPCSAEDPAPHPDTPTLVGFHSTSVDGETDVHLDPDCPWIEGMSGSSGVGNAVPVVWDITTESTTGVTGAVEGSDYWLFDLEPTPLSGCAHLDFGPDATVVCTEQGSGDAAYRECTLPDVSLASCRSEGGEPILFDRVFGFALDDGMYRNVRDDPTQPLFEHPHPADLPDSDRYWSPEETCPVYLTKYVELGDDDLLVATVMCRSKTQDATLFSRLMLIDTADPQNPGYVDLTSLLEAHDPERWPAGSAFAFTGSFS